MFQLFIELSRIKKCFTLKGGIFVLEEFGKTTVTLSFSFPSPNASLCSLILVIVGFAVFAPCKKDLFMCFMLFTLEMARGYITGGTVHASRNAWLSHPCGIKHAVIHLCLMPQPTSTYQLFNMFFRKVLVDLL